jgi:hypothetical protein
MEYKLLSVSEQRIKDILHYLDELVAMQGNPTQAALFAYIAGIIDGEGTIRISKSKIKSNWNFTYNAMMSCGMVTKEIPVLLYSTLGGSYREERVVGKRSIWRWNLNGRFQIYAALTILKPYLIVKKRQAELALEFCEKWKNPKRNHHLWVVDTQQLQWREDSYFKMLELNAVGAGATTKRVGTRECEAIV